MKAFGCALLIALLAASGVPGAPSLLNFDNLADGELITTQFPGLVFSHAAILTAGVSLNEFEFPPASGFNTAIDDDGPITITFAQPVNSFRGRFTYRKPVRVKAFDGAGVTIASANSRFSSNMVLSGETGSSANEPIFVAAPGGISSVTIEGDTAGSSFALDNLETNFDTAAPATTAVRDPSAPPEDDWNKQSVTVRFSVADNDGGVGVREIVVSATGGQSLPSTVFPSSSASLTVSTEGITSISYFSRDAAGNAETPRNMVVRVDTTAPIVKCAQTDGQWHSNDVTLACTGSDATSGLADPFAASFDLATSVQSGTETAMASTGTLSICDRAGNCTTAGPITGIKVDKKAPTITVASPAPIAYTLNSAVFAQYSCADGGSGAVGCTGTVSAEQAIDTGSVGQKQFRVMSSDDIGNASTPTVVSYSVGYKVCALYDASKAVRSGSTIPLKIQLCDAKNNNVSNQSIVVHGGSLVQTSTTASVEIQDSGNANPDMNFRFDSGLGPTGGYIFNLSTTGLATGSYQLKVTAGVDPTPHNLSFQVR